MDHISLLKMRSMGTCCPDISLIFFPLTSLPSLSTAAVCVCLGVGGKCKARDCVLYVCVSGGGSNGCGGVFVMMKLLC